MVKNDDITYSWIRSGTLFRQIGCRGILNRDRSAKPRAGKLAATVALAAPLSLQLLVIFFFVLLDHCNCSLVFPLDTLPVNSGGCTPTQREKERSCPIMCIVL